MIKYEPRRHSCRLDIECEICKDWGFFIRLLALILREESVRNCLKRSKVKSPFLVLFTIIIGKSYNY